MNFQKVAIDQVGQSESRSEMAEVFYEFRKGALSEENYHIMNAAYVSHRINDYVPKYPDELTEQSRAYLKGRSTGFTEYNPIEAARVGRWLEATTRKLVANEADASLLAWAREKLKDVKIGDAIRKIDAMLVRHSQVAVDYDSIRLVLLVKDLDASERLRSRK